MTRILHCWQGENDENEVGSDEWAEIFLRGDGTCMLPDGHDGPHAFTPDDRLFVRFNEEKLEGEKHRERKSRD